LQDTDFVVVAGRPGMGKTALATNIAFNVAKHEHPVGFFSLEMSAEQLATRVLAQLTGVASHDIRRGKIDEYKFGKLNDSAFELSGMPFYIDETSGISIAQLVTRARRMKRQYGIELVVVDYLQLLHGSNRRENRVQEITEITTQLKSLAKEIRVPVLGVSQLSRSVEHRDDKRPQLSDLRESGSIEQDADVVTFVFREEYYLLACEPDVKQTEAHAKWLVDMNAAKGKADLLVSKHRHGPTGVIKLQFDARFTRFSDLADERV
jgi:replicative DNA helicase